MTIEELRNAAAAINEAANWLAAQFSSDADATQVAEAKTEKKMMELVQKKEKLVREEISKADALKFFAARGQNYKNELIADLEDGTITTYTQGNYTDLCRGPHLVDTSAIKAVKLTATSAAYWRGDEKRPQMTRIYGISFPKKKMLDEYVELR